jgi:hypothetical protein
MGNKRKQELRRATAAWAGFLTTASKFSKTFAQIFFRCDCGVNDKTKIAAKNCGVLIGWRRGGRSLEPYSPNRTPPKKL